MKEDLKKAIVSEIRKSFSELEEHFDVLGEPWDADNAVGAIYRYLKIHHELVERLIKEEA